jgi:hypothetical protein
VSAVNSVPPPSAPYQTSPVKTGKGENRPIKPRKSAHQRRTKAELQTLLEAVLRITDEDPPISLRHLFYRVSGEHLIEKSEREYCKLCSLLSDWRKAGAVSFDVFTDGTRFYRGPRLFDGMAAALENTAACYRKNLWLEQPYYAELWCEKDSVSAILTQAASPWGVQTFVCRGFASLSSLNHAARTFRAAQGAGKQVRVLFFGDHDPSGLLIDAVAQRTLANDFGVAVEFRRIAVTPAQIISLGLPTRPTKTTTHSRGWTGGESVELDTIRPADLRSMVDKEITSLIEPGAWERLRAVEAEERNLLKQVWRTAA